LQIGEWVDNNVRQARHLHPLAEKHPEFEAASHLHSVQELLDNAEAKAAPCRWRWLAEQLSVS
jgi:hypothetical protein